MSEYSQFLERILTAAEKRLKWQPIETAPTDGSAVILYCPGMCHWHRLDGMPDIVTGIFCKDRFPPAWYSDYGDIDHGYESTGAYFEHEPLSPTHWAPLPAPPNEKEPGHPEG